MYYLGFLIVFLIVWETILPLHVQNENRFFHVIKNLAIFIVARLVLFGISFLFLEQYQFYTLKPILGSWYIIYVFVLSDLAVYWWHRLNHRISFLWRFHKVHHSDDFLDFSSAFRFHFGELSLSYFGRGLVFLLLGFEIHEVLLYNILLTAANLFHHANIALPTNLERFLSRYIVTPKYHQTHHSVFFSLCDSNFSSLWIGWDKIFGTYNGIKNTNKVGMPVDTIN